MVKAVCGPRRWVRNNASPPPTPAPPRFPACNHPDAEPRSFSDTTFAISPSVAIPSNVTAVALRKIRVRSNGILSGPTGTKPTAIRVPVVSTLDARYHFRRVHSMSGSGAQKNLNVCGKMLRATRPAMAASPIPACLAR